MSLTRGNQIRSGGVALAGLLSSRRARAAVLAGTYVAGWVAGPPGFQLWSLSGVESDNPVVRDSIPLATSTVSWTAAHLAVLAGLGALPLPRLVTLPAYAAALAAAEPKVLAAVSERPAPRRAG